MGKINNYRAKLKTLGNWDAYLLRESGLPGPRGNLELAQAVADQGNAKLFARYISFDARQAPENTAKLFLAFCGVLGLGTLVAKGEKRYLKTLREFGSDTRWRIREAVAMALQRWGDADMNGLIKEMKGWSEGDFYEQRAVVAALCEPRLLHDEKHAKQVLDILDKITGSLLVAKQRNDQGFEALRKALAYGWSVAVVAVPEAGKAMLERWLTSEDKDIRWIVKENLKKNRLQRLDARWVKWWSARLERKK
ncbi:MAG: hypothetical protein HYX86_04750 [Chloroflexi bacterium]|nr:hypothetical protein [Chloroflexota bacterium]